MNILDFILSVLDQPAVQQPVATAIATEIKAQTPPGAEKAIKDLLALVVASL